ncbi:hypothetical protein E2I00_016791, partial [Balaenoptera physalus]
AGVQGWEAAEPPLTAEGQLVPAPPAPGGLARAQGVGGPSQQPPPRGAEYWVAPAPTSFPAHPCVHSDECPEDRLPVGSLLAAAAAPRPRGLCRPVAACEIQVWRPESPAALPPLGFGAQHTAAADLGPGCPGAIPPLRQLGGGPRPLLLTVPGGSPSLLLTPDGVPDASAPHATCGGRPLPGCSGPRF